MSAFLPKMTGNSKLHDLFRWTSLGLFWFSVLSVELPPLFNLVDFSMTILNNPESEPEEATKPHQTLKEVIIYTISYYSYLEKPYDLEENIKYTLQTVRIDSHYFAIIL